MKYPQRGNRRSNVTKVTKDPQYHLVKIQK